MVALVMTSSFILQEMRLKKMDTLVGTKVSVKNASVQTYHKGDNLKSITIQDLSKLLTSRLLRIYRETH